MLHVVYVVFWLLYPSVLSPAEALLASSGQHLILGQNVESFYCVLLSAC